MRVCIVGNSHIAALKNAWDSSDLKTGDLADSVFFGTHSASLRRVSASGGKFVTTDAVVRRALAMTTGLADPELMINGFDCYLLHALINPNWVTPYTLRLARHCAVHDAIASSGLVRAVTAEIYRRSILAHMLGVIRSATDAPIFVSPQPYVSQALLDDDTQGLSYDGLENLDEFRGPSFAGAFDSVLMTAAVEHSFALLPQPAETIVNDGCFTAHEYCSDSVRLSAGMDVKHPVDDFAHMNQRYGALVLRDLAASLKPLRTPASLAASRGR